MEYPVEIEGCGHLKITVKPKTFFRGPQLLVDGQPASQGPKAGQMIIKNSQGRDLLVQWQPQLLGMDAPQLMVEGKQVQVVKPLKWYAVAWCGLPLVLIVQGGFLGALTGILGTYFNLAILRSNQSMPVKILTTAGISVLTGVLYVILAYVFLSLFKKP